MKILRRGIRLIEIIVLVLAAAIIGIAIMLNIYNIQPAVCLSGSMEPAIHTGSLLFIDNDYAGYNKRDIIAFERNGGLVTHRIEEVRDEGFVTKGDANECADLGLVRIDEVKGRVIAWFPYVGYWIKALRGRIGMSAIILLCVLSLFCGSLSKKEEGSDDRKKNTVGADNPTA